MYRLVIVSSQSCLNVSLYRPNAPIFCIALSPRERTTPPAATPSQVMKVVLAPVHRTLPNSFSSCLEGHESLLPCKVSMPMHWHHAGPCIHPHVQSCDTCQHKHRCAVAAVNGATGVLYLLNSLCTTWSDSGGQQSSNQQWHPYHHIFWCGASFCNFLATSPRAHVYADGEISKHQPCRSVEVHVQG
jgi:hypothetical protein